MDTKRIKGFLLVLVASFCYGVMPAVTQLSFKAGLAIETMLPNRYLIALSITWLYIFATKAEWRLSRRQLAYLMGVGSVYIGVALFINMSYEHLPGALTSILVFLYVSIVVLLEIVSGREKAAAVKLLCVILSLAGLVLVVWDPSGSGKASLIGIALALAAGFCYALYAFALGARITSDLDSIVIVGYTLIIPTIGYHVLCLLSGQPLLPQQPSHWLYIIGLAFFCTFYGSLCFCKAVRLIGSGNASIINTLEPVIAYFAGMLLLGDILERNAIIGGCIIIAAIILLNVSDGVRQRTYTER